MKRNEDPRATGDGQAAQAPAQANAVGLPDVLSPEWVECTELVGADATQVRVYLGSGTKVLLKAVPGCGSLELAHALIQQSGLTSTDWNWMLDLKELRSCDMYLLGTLLAIGNYLRRGGGRLTLYNPAGVPIPPYLLGRFLRYCRECRIQFGASECVEWRFRDGAEGTDSTLVNGRARSGTTVGAI